MPFIGTAGWSIPRAVADRFPGDGSALARYATVFSATEINSTFYRRHRPQTFERWVESVPDAFRFSVKVPKRVTHDLRLVDATEPLQEFLEDIRPLRRKLGPLLLQLPPTLDFEEEKVARCLGDLRQNHAGTIVVEPRHSSWGSDAARRFLESLAIGRVLADPEKIPGEALPVEGTPGERHYLRLHGKPRVYYSSYSAGEIGSYAGALSDDDWCIFDNTASGAAIENALEMIGWFERQTRASSGC